MTTLLLVAGDVSGDHHAADFVRAFKRLRPGTRFVGMGGAAMEGAGVEVTVPQRALAVGGFFGLGSSAGSIFRAWREMSATLSTRRPDLVVLVDSGGFNIPFAGRVKRVSNAPVLYYVTPQVWAWRSGRIRRLARRVDRLAVLFPFERDFYARSGVRVDCVGHPLVDRLESQGPKASKDEARRELGLDVNGPLIALLPGSRRNEIRQHLSLQLAAADRILKQVPDAKFVVALAPSLDRHRVESLITSHPNSDRLAIAIVEDRAWSILGCADAALLKPGTATLEAALLGCPMVVMGRVGRLTAAILRRNLKIAHLALPNLVLDDSLVPELLQADAQPERIAAELLPLLSGPARDRQLKGFDRVRCQLGDPGASSRAARIAEAMVVDREA